MGGILIHYERGCNPHFHDSHTMPKAKSVHQIPFPLSKHAPKVN